MSTAQLSLFATEAGIRPRIFARTASGSTAGGLGWLAHPANSKAIAAARNAGAAFISLALEALCHDVDLARLRARGCRLADQHFLKRLAQFLHVFIRPRALEHFRREVGA